MMKRIAIVGAGWLGLPLAKHLQKIGHEVRASRTSSQGKQELESQGIKGFVCDLNSDGIDDLSSLNCDTVVGSFPPGFRKGNGDEYIHQWAKLVEQSKRANVKKIIMISSTTVYPNRAETMNEDKASLDLCENNPDFSANANRMLQAEQSVIESGLDYVIVRCSGLIGPKRHPARFASKLKQVSRLAPANMLHLFDAVGVVTFAIENLNQEIVNASTPETVDKAEFYQAALDSIHSDDPLPPVVDVPDKKIVSDKLIKAGYQFQFSNTLEALIGDE